MQVFNQVGIILLLLASFLSLNAQSENASKDSSKTTFTTVLPLVFYTPETSLGLGAAGVRNFYPGIDSLNRPSQLQLGGAYTFRNQIAAYFSYQLFLRGNRTEIFGELGYYDYLYFYYGMGNDTRQDMQETYQVRFPRIRLSALEQILPNLRAGISFKFDNYELYQREEQGLLDTQQPTGFMGGNVATFGTVFRYDTRDDVNLPLQGWLVTLNLEQNLQVLSSPYLFRRALLDIVRYQAIGRDQTIALNFYTGTMSGEIPFQELLFMGGAKKGRGIIDGRFRDQNLVLWQAAYRFPLFWRLRAAIFASTGRVAAEYEDLWSGQYHFNYGMGLRFLLNEDERVQVRCDIGLGGDQLGFYFTVNDAF